MSPLRRRRRGDDDASARRAFTLIELLVAMAIATIIAAVAVGAGMLLNRTMVDTRKRAAVWDEAKRLEEAMLSQLQEAGGDPLRPHQAILVENDCTARDGMPTCFGADRINITRARPGLPACKVSGNSGANLNVDALSGVCCLFIDETGATVSTSPWERQAALLVKPDGSVEALHLHTASDCKINAPKGQGNPGVPALGAGTLVAVEVVTIFPMRQPGGDYQLAQWIDASVGAAVPNGVVDPDELLLIADRVFDFQVALGFDGAPEDGEVIDLGTNADEWFGNASGDALPSSVSPDQLRMVGVGIVVGTRSDRARSAQVLDGGPKSIPGMYLATTRGTVMMRNLNIALP